MTYLLIYLIGVFVAQMQLHYWTRNLLLSEEEFDTMLSLCLLSWGIYPVYFIYNILEYLKGKEQ